MCITQGAQANFCLYVHHTRCSSKHLREMF